jgi:D-arabinose 1-dehydrogenase-like Zn-dependent alcohol dehydrogenase
MPHRYSFYSNDFGMLSYPLVPGHEIVGKVTAVSDHVTKFKKGDTVGIGCLLTHAANVITVKMILSNIVLMVLPILTVPPINWAMVLGAHNFIINTNEEQVKNVQGKFDFILDTVSADHDYNFYVTMLKTRGVMTCVGLPNAPAVLPGFNLVFQGRSFAGSLIGGIAETQDVGPLCC